MSKTKVLALALLLVLSGAAYALDAPHTPINNVSCSSCHTPISSLALNDQIGTHIDNTVTNIVCRECHRASGTATEAAVHSSRTTGSESEFGAWTVECRTCHEPHYQRQPRRWGSEAVLFSGQVASVGPYDQATGTRVITLNGDPGWSAGQWTGYIIKPFSRYQFYLDIQDNGSNTLTVKLCQDNEPRNDYANYPDCYKINYYFDRYLVGQNVKLFYGMFVRDEINSGKVVEGDTYNTDSDGNPTSWRLVKLYNASGDYNLSSATEKYRAVCVVCHTEPGVTVNNYVKVLNGTDQAHNEGSYCFADTSNCHKPHKQGFDQAGAACGDCHGAPPSTTDPWNLVKAIKESGSLETVYTGVTGNAVGAHVVHYNKYQSCDVCHYGGMVPAETDTDIGDYYIEMSFWLNSPTDNLYTAGYYKGHTTLQNGFVYNGTAVGTGPNAPDDSYTCTNLYCHGSTMVGTANEGAKTVPVWSGGASEASCGNCHRATSSNPPGLGSHLVHVGDADATLMAPLSCDLCHGHSGSGSKHVDGDASWAFSTADSRTSGALYNGLSSGGRGPVPSSTYSDCTNLYCHSNANPYGGTNQYQTVTWGGAAMDCASCHDAQGSSPTHTVHVSDTGYDYRCSACHNTVIDDATADTAISNRALHVDGTKQVVFNGVNPSGGFDLGTHSCSSLYCHSNASPVGGTNAYATPSWSGTVSCADCHEYSDTRANMEAAGSTGLSNVHIIHVADDEYGTTARGSQEIGCQSCHNTTTTDGSTIADYSLHVDGAKDVSFDSLWGGSYSAGTYTCSNVYCHSTGTGTYDTPTWDNAASGACGTCHGSTASNPPASAAHDKHVGSSYPYLYECYKCHKDVVSSVANSTIEPAVTNKVLHVDKIANVILNTADSLVGSGATHGAGECDNIYCHSTGKLAVPVANLPAAYNGSHYAIANWATDTTVCNSCHGRSRADGRPDYTDSGVGGSADANSHVKAADGSDFPTHAAEACNTCHASTVDINNTPLSLHVDGAIDVVFNTGGWSYDPSDKSCGLTCHDYTHNLGQTKWGGLACGGCHGIPPDTEAELISTYPTGRDADFANGAGAHGLHAVTKGYACSVCHTGGQPTNSAQHNEASPDAKLHIGFVVFGVEGGLYQAPALSEPGNDYTDPGIFNGNATVVNVPSGAERVCSNIYCHSDGGDYSGTITYRYANWDDTFSYPADCNRCHGQAGGEWVSTNVHPIHADSTKYDYDCVECHADTVDASDNLIGNHVNNAKDVRFGGSIADSGTYSRPNCSSLYCHSQGQSDTDFGGGNASLSTAAWNGTLPADCTGCHAGAAGATAEMGTYAHGTHINNASVVGYKIGCQECHSATTSDNTTISTYAEHVNRLVNVKFSGVSNDSDSPTYAGSSTTGASGATKAPGSAVGDCANVYCHSDGNVNTGGATESITFKAIAWDAAGIGCDGCHGDAAGKAHPVYATGGGGTDTANSHVEHVESSAYGCDYCHLDTTHDAAIPPTFLNTTSGLHLNRAEDVSFKVVGGATGTYDGGTKVCSSTYCHGGSSPAWGATGVLNCESCHQSQGPDSGTFTGVHAGHTNATGGKPYALACENCHRLQGATATEHSGGPYADPQTTEVLFANSAGSRTYGDGTESYRYVDLYTNPFLGTGVSPGYTADSVAAGTDSVNSAITWTAGTCSSVWCHSNADPYGGSNAYQSPTWSGTLDCGGCHSQAGEGSPTWSPPHTKHVDDYSANAEFDCNACHADTASDNTTISGLAAVANHVDGEKDVVFNTWVSPDGGANPYDLGNHQCSNTYCHSAGTSATAPTHAAVSWSGTMPADCTGCHGGDAASVSQMGTMAHPGHIDDADNEIGRNIACIECHAATVSDNTTIASKALHVNQLINVKFTNSLDSSPTYNGVDATTANGAEKVPGDAGYTCAGIYCHSSGNTARSATPTYNNVDWNAGTLTCDACHGDGAGKAHPVYATGGEATATANSHVAHVEWQGYSCDLCHVQTTHDTAIPPTFVNATSGLHLNSAENVDFIGNVGGSWSEASATCSSTRCHGSVSDGWGLDLSSYNNCTICHGQLTTGADGFTNAAAPGAGGSGVDTAGDTADTDPQVGAHRVHMEALSAISNATDCTECHAVPASMNASGHIDTALPAEITFGSLAKTGGANPTYDPGTGTCSNVYCHDSQYFKNAWSGGDDRAPVWSNATYLDPDGDGLLDAEDCDQCHGYPPSPADGHPDNTSCSSCHTNVAADNVSFSDPASHVDGNVTAEAGESSGGTACAGCHGDLYNRMHNNVANMVYKHYLNNDSATYLQNTSTPHVLGGQSDTDRNCLMCHADHDMFNPSVNAEGERAANLRTTVAEIPDNAADTGFTNSDYIGSGDGGVCLSCHRAKQQKAVSTNNAVNEVPPIPYPDNSTPNYAPSDAVQRVKNSTHNYAVQSGVFGDGSSFQAVCTKCHNDTIGGDGGNKSSVGGQGSDPKFGLHQSSKNSFFAVMGTGNFKDFVYGTLTAVSGTTVTVDQDLTKDYTGYAIVVTNATGYEPSQRAIVTATDIANDTVSVESWPLYTPNVNDIFEIVKNITPIEEVCFNCHSQPANGFKPYDGVDFYNAVAMSDKLEGMYDLFIGDNGKVESSQAAATQTVDICTAKTLAGDEFVGYVFKSGVQKKTITANTTTTDGAAECSSFSGYPNLATLTLESKLATQLSNGDNYQILKPAVHPLDTLGRHKPDEVLTAPSSAPASLSEAWNAGDMGTCDAAADQTTCQDSTKAWPNTDQFVGLSITFYTGDCSGQSFSITASSTDTVSFDTGGACTPAVGDSYYIGTRHVSCSDCHNTHAAQVNPMGTVSGGTTTTVQDGTKTFEKTGWANDRWKGYLMVFTDSNGVRRVRPIAGSSTDSTGTTYTLAIPLPAAPAAGDHYEVLRHDGATGSGGKGVWGVEITGYSSAGQDPSTLTYTKKYDAGGDAGGKQYEQCLRCHSYYSYLNAIPSTPSGGPDGSAAAETDIAKEINPQNYAHHAIYAVGRNQPIVPDGSTAPVVSQYWPVQSNTISSYDSGTGVATLGSSLPDTALPGWYVIDTGANVAYQIVEILSTTQIRIAATNGNPWDANATYPASIGSNVDITAGLGNTFVPPYGPWSIIRCTDCHGSTLQDPLGPHASVNKWLLKSLDTALKFEFWDGSSVVEPVPNSGADTAIWCFNCHRRDVYGDGNNYNVDSEVLYRIYSRVPHSGTTNHQDGTGMEGMFVDDFNIVDPKYATVWPEICRHCHLGYRLGGSHGTWLVDPDPGDGNSSELGEQGRRFLNGATWDAYDAPTTGSTITCYTIGSATSVSSCTKHDGGEGGKTKATYDYTGIY
jgi:predicted CxxxxCH...CXXCH cytochrome family protein